MAPGMIGPGVEQVSMGPDGEPQMDGGMMASFGDTSNTEVAPPPPPPDRKKVVIMPGDTLRVRLLSGVHAPTDGTPYPVVVEAVGDVQGPDGSSLPIGKARFVVAAQGSLSDSRALFRMTTMNIRLPNGEKQEVPVDGWLVGEDGIRGLQGVLLDPIGKAIGAAMEAGVLQGIGEGFAATQTSRRNGFYGDSTTDITGDPLIFAGGKGLSEGANEFKQMIKERAALLVPHVEVYSGRTATAVFSKTVTIDGLFEALEDDGVGFPTSLD
jgi:conjugal transfer pilus assembly protein TraB